MDKLLEHKNKIDTTETLISIYIYDKKKCEIINYYKDQLEKAKNITNPIKKHKINNRLYNFINYIENNYLDENEILNKIYFIEDNIIEYNLTKDEIKIAKEFKFIQLYYKTDSYFHIEYFIDLFHNINFHYNIKINKNDLYLNKYNRNKEIDIQTHKINNETKIIEVINYIRQTINYKDIIIIHGNSPYINKIQNKQDTIIENTFLSKEDCYKIIEENIMKDNFIQLDKRINELQNNPDLYVFGKLNKEIKESVELYLLKELYIEEKKLNKLKSIINNDSYFNFKIIPIKSIKGGDTGDIFIKNYNGIMGIKYF